MPPVPSRRYCRRHASLSRDSGQHRRALHHRSIRRASTAAERDDQLMRPRILVVAYACEPGAGSESGAGWVWPRMLARIADVWVVTRENNQRAIEAALPEVPEREHLRFVYVDLPERLRFWKRGHRRARLYYLIWQAMMVREARRIDSEVGFDAVWHLTMSTVWLGSLAPLLRKPFVFGPVGGGVG